MRRASEFFALALTVALLSALPASPAAAVDALEPTLWLTDNVTRMTYNVTLDGDVIKQFRPPAVRSSIAIDPVDRTLWGTSDGASSLIINYDREGRVLNRIDAADFGGVQTEGLDITVSTDDVTLWIVDDPLAGGGAPRVYNVSRSGELLGSFPTPSFDPLSISPQAIAYDPYTSSLWITDNASDKVYNVSLTGELLSSFGVDNETFGWIGNVQGISVESSEVLWITGRDTDRVYRVKKSGEGILSEFPISVVDTGAGDPEGVAFDRPPGYVGAAASFAVFGLADSKLRLKDGDRSTGLVGDVGLGPNATQMFDEGLLTGTLLVDPTADNSNVHGVAISEGVEARDLALAASDAAFSSLAASVLAPTQVVGEIKDTTSIIGDTGVNVIDVTKIDLDNDETLTLVGDPSSAFVLNVAGKLKLNHRSRITLEGGLSAHNVFLNVEGTDDSSIEEGSVATGTIVAPRARLTIKGAASTMLGAVIGGREVKLEDGGRLRSLDAALPPGDIGTTATAGVLGLPGAKVKIDDNGSSVIGDVALGPYATQGFNEGVLSGALLVDPLADNTRDNAVVITGGAVEQQLSRAVADAVDGSHGLARLPADQAVPEIRTSTVINGGDGLTVIESKKIELDRGATLTIEGSPASVFVFNLEEKIKLKDASSVVLTGGVSAQNVLFNVVGDHDSSVEGGSAATGTILAPFAKVKVKEPGSTLEGSAISGDEVVVEKSGTIRHTP